MKNILQIIVIGFLSISSASALAISKAQTPAKKSLFATLQNSYTPQAILNDVGKYISHDTDPQGILSSLILVRLSKQLITMDNMKDQIPSSIFTNGILEKIVNEHAKSDWIETPQSIENAIEATKAACVISKLSPDEVSIDTWQPLIEKWHDKEILNCLSGNLEPHHLSGLKWAFDVFGSSCALPNEIQNAYDELNLPFRVRTGICKGLPGLSVANLIEEVNFKQDDIRTQSNRVVKERRKTAWQGDDHVAPFAYSGKSMERDSWSRAVISVRDFLKQETGEYYDGCLLNLYPDGGSGMRYHIDPDQGDLWDYETAVVSIGATRRFLFRNIPDADKKDTKPHVFVLFEGDVTEMFGDCQLKYQHTVKTAEGKHDTASRASLVFKRTFSG